MKKTCLMMLMLVAFTAGAWGDETPAPKTATIGGGVVHPWKSPYRTAVGQMPEILPAN